MKHRVELPGGKIVEVEHGQNLRLALRKDFSELYHPLAKWIHCRGLGTCGTCAVKIYGKISEPTAVERWRLSFPPHQIGSDLRLACQVKIEGDLRLEKGDGLWGSDFSEGKKR